MNINASKVDVVNQLAHQLLDVDHPNSNDVEEKQNELRQRWANLGALADEKRDALNSTFAIQTFHIEVKETIIWIRDKTTLIQSTEELGTGNHFPRALRPYTNIGTRDARMHLGGPLPP